MKQIGKIIYSYRKINHLSQDELANIAGVSSAAVSKWERNLSVPDVEVLCRLADYFEVTVDELLGRNQEKQMPLTFASPTDAERFYLASELLKCCSLARNQGLLAVEEYARKLDGSFYDFLKFTAGFLWEGLRQQIPPLELREFLLRYAESEKDTRAAKMVSDVITHIYSGKNEQVIREVLRSWLGRKYARAFVAEEQEKWRNLNREERIQYYSAFQSGISDTGLLDELLQLEDESFQKIFRNFNDVDFVRAMAGASETVRKRLFHHFSDYWIVVLGEELMSFSEGLEEVKNAQRRLLELLGE